MQASLTRIRARIRRRAYAPHTRIPAHTAAVQRYTYSSFGKIESQLDPNFVQPYTFTAREFDGETGLYYYRARYYDSATGRFLSEDPMDIPFLSRLRRFRERSTYRSEDTPEITKRFLAGVNFHAFVYVNNGATNYTDPLGLQVPENPAERPLSVISTLCKSLEYVGCQAEWVKLCKTIAFGVALTGAVTGGIVTVAAIVAFPVAPVVAVPTFYEFAGLALTSTYEAIQLGKEIGILKK